jgi:hypothetical protein
MADLERISKVVKTKKINPDDLNETTANLGSFMGWEDGENENDLDEAPNANTGINQNARYVEIYPGASDTYGKGSTFMDAFNSDKYAGHRHQNLYYPFQTRSEWELASWLLRSGLSMRAIDDFLSLELVSLSSYLE